MGGSRSKLTFHSALRKFFWYLTFLDEYSYSQMMTTDYEANILFAYPIY